MKVTHPIFGQGQVIEQTDKTVTVDFNGAKKVLDVKFSKLSYEDGTLFSGTFKVEPKKAKKINKANFMREDEFSKSKYATMSKGEFEEDIRKAAMASKSW